jgi:flagellar biosynthesis/type III secretory pathway protein FliH
VTRFFQLTLLHVMVAAPMRTRFDQFGKQMVRTALELQAEAPERTLALPILLRLRLAVPSDPTKQTTDDQEFLMDTQDIVETWRREAVQEGVQKGLKQGVKQGVAHSLVAVYEARFGAMPEDLRAVVEDTDDEPTLVAWLRLAGTRGAGEIAAAIRAFRAS